MTPAFFIQGFEAIMETNNVGRRDWKREVTLTVKMFHWSPVESWLNKKANKRGHVDHKQTVLSI